MSKPKEGYDRATLSQVYYLLRVIKRVRKCNMKPCSAMKTYRFVKRLVLLKSK